MRKKLVFILLVTSLSLNAQRRSDIVYCSIAQIKAEGLKSKKCVDQLIPTVLISGKPASETTVKIRCSSTVLSGNQPLFIVDGVLYEPAKINTSNPDNIVSIDVLNTPKAEVIFGCRAVHGVVIITTKKYYDREFFIKDAKDRVGVSYATIAATAIKTGNSVTMEANEFGRIETSLLKSLDYKLTISRAGYKTKTIMLKEVISSKYEILLERDILELSEIEVVAGNIRKCKKTFTCCLTGVTSCNHLMSSFRCLTKGVAIYEEKNQTGNRLVQELKVKIYPNPVSSSSTVNLSFPKLKEGLYQIRLLNAAGQLFYSVQKQIGPGRDTEQIHLNSSMAQGIYLIQIIDADNKLLQSSRLIVQ